MIACPLANAGPSGASKLKVKFLSRGLRHRANNDGPSGASYRTNFSPSPWKHFIEFSG